MVRSRLVKTSKRVLAVLGPLILVAAVLPAVAATPVARLLARWASASHCGRFTVAKAEVGWTTVLRLVSGRPVPIGLHDVTVDSPARQRVFSADRIEATVTVRWWPPGVASASVLVGDGAWRLSPEGQVIGLAAAFRSLPAQGRGACLAAEPPAPARPVNVAPLRLAVRIRHVSSDLDFPTWGLELGRADASGELRLGGRTPFGFDVRDISAEHSRLRIGPPGGRAAVTIPFTAVAIAHVGIPASSPADLLLEVQEARTGRSLLSGRATFTNVFAVATDGSPPAGIDLDARWLHLRDVLLASEGEWLPRGAWADHLDSDLAATLHGPFAALAATAVVTGAHGRLAGSLGHGRARLGLSLAGLDTGWMLDPVLVPWLSGRLTGRLEADASLGQSLATTTAELTAARFRVDRDPERAGPRAIEIGIGATARAPASPDVLRGTIGAVRLVRGAVRLVDARIGWVGIEGRGNATVALPGTAVAGAPARRARSFVAAHGALTVDPGRWLVQAGPGLPLRLSASAQGTLERLRFDLRIRPTTVTAFGERYQLPSAIGGQWTAADGLRLPPLTVAREGGGRVTLAGRLSREHGLAARLRVRGYPVTALPALARRPSWRALGGKLDADLALGGSLARPTLAGRIEVENASVRDRSIGDVRAHGRLGGRGGVVTVTLGPGAVLTGHIRRRAGVAVDAQLELDHQPIGVWLPPPLAGLPLLASGRADLTYRRGKPVAGRGRFELVGPGGLKLVVSGAGRGRDIHSRIAGDIDLASWRRVLLGRYLTSATGVLHLDGIVAPGPELPSVSGTATVAQALVLGLPGWRAPLTVAAGGKLEVDGDEVSTAGLDLRSTGLDAVVGGYARIDRHTPAQSQVALRLSAAVDAERLPFPIPAAAAVAGHLLVDARIAGVVAAGPRIDGRVRFDDLAVRFASPSLPRLRARGEVEVRASTLGTRDLRLDIAQVGRVRVGSFDAPATAEVVSLHPFRLGPLDVPLAGEHLVLGDATSGLRAGDVSARVRLAGDARGQLSLVGAVEVAGASYDVGGGYSDDRPSKAPWFRRLPAGLTLDLDVRGPARAFSVGVPVLPDPAFNFHCHVIASRQGVRSSGRIVGSSLYARVALGIYDWLSSNELGRCQIASP